MHLGWTQRKPNTDLLERNIRLWGRLRERCESTDFIEDVEDERVLSLSDSLSVFTGLAKSLVFSSRATKMFHCPADGLP